MRLTLKSVVEVKLPPGKADLVVFDDDISGFGLRLRQGGTCTWIYRYRIGRKQRSITLGNAKAVPLALARENAGRLEAKVRLGGDPAMDKQTARIEADLHCGGLIDEYLDTRKDDWRPNSLRQVRRHLLDYAKPLHRLPIAAISQRQVANLLRDIAELSGDVSANRLRASLATFFVWAIRQGIKLPEGNVASYTQPRKENSRERVLSPTEIKAIWQSLNDDDYGAIIKLLILTGQREAEIGGLRFDEVQDGQIVLPSSRTKNKRPHTVPLSAPARAIVDKFRIHGRSRVFGRNDTNGFRGWGVSKRRLDERIAKINGALAPWVVHDIRRTCATGMVDLKVLPHVVEAVLNHVSGHKAGVAGIYNLSIYASEKREALSLWAEFVLKTVG